MSKTKAKFCPLVKEDCMKTGCELYNELLNRCDLGLLTYNMYRLSEVMTVWIEAMIDSPEKAKESMPARWKFRKDIEGKANDRRILQ